jgi:hypothetical protein
MSGNTRVSVAELKQSGRVENIGHSAQSLTAIANFRSYVARSVDLARDN